MFYKGNEDREKRLRFSIRKVSFGAASVAVAALFMFPGNGTVSATEQGVTPTNEGRQDSPLKDPDVQNGTYGATPVVSQLDGNSGGSETTAPKDQEETTTPTSTDASASSVESPTVSKEKEETSTAATPAPVASSTASATEKAEEKATSDLDKKQLEDYVAEIDAKLASGSYATKTDESVATLKEHLELAKLALTTATSQDELTKAYRRLFMTASSGLRSKPKAQVESPKLDTTEGKATVGKKASNTEKATGTNSIANSGQHDPRNRQALDRNNPFRTDGATTDTDPAANQTYTAPRVKAGLDELTEKLLNLPERIQNNDSIKDGAINKLGAEKNVEVGHVKEINDFGGWKAVGDGKFAIGRKTKYGTFPIETINSLLNDTIYLREQSFDKTQDYMLFLTKARTRANSNEEAFDGSAYKYKDEGLEIAKAVKGFDGIEKTFKAYSSEDGSRVKVSFKPGYTGDIDGKKAKYKVEVFSIKEGVEKKIYSTEFYPDKSVKDADKTVIAAKDGTNAVSTRVSNTGSDATKPSDTRRGYIGRDEVEKRLATPANLPNGTEGTFTSRDIELEKGVDSYKVRISSADNSRVGMSYQAWDLKYALPISSLDFSIDQDTNNVARNLLQKVYEKLLETRDSDKRGKTPETQQAYQHQLDAINQLLAGELKSTAEYKKILNVTLQKQAELKVDKSTLTSSKASLDDLVNDDPTPGKTPETVAAYNQAKTAAEQEAEKAKAVIDSDTATVDEVAQAVANVTAKRAELTAARALLVVAASDDQKTKLQNDSEALKEADKIGKTPKSIKEYEDKYKTLEAALTAAKEQAKTVLDKTVNAGKVEATYAQIEVDKIKAELDKAATLLKDKGKTTELEQAKNDLNDFINQQTTARVTEGQTKDSQDAYTTAKAAADKAVTDAQAVIASENSTVEDVANALADIKVKRAALEAAKKNLVPAATEAQKAKLEKTVAKLVEASTEGKTQDSINTYNEKIRELTEELNQAKAAADKIKTDGVNATKLAALEAQEAVNTVLEKLATAKEALVEKATDEQKTALEGADAALTPIAENTLTGVKTPNSIEAYNQAVAAIQADLTQAKAKAAELVEKAKDNNATKADATVALAKVEELKAKLAEAKGLLKDKANTTELTNAKEALKALAATENVTAGKTKETADKYDAAKVEADQAVKDAETLIADPNATPEQVATALANVNTKKAALEKVKEALVDKITQDQKDELANADEDLKLADKTGKTNDSIKAYNDEVGKLSADLEAAKQAAKDLLAKGDNAGELEAYRLQAKIDKLKSKLATAAKLLKDIDKSAVKKEVEEAAKNATDTIEANVDLPADKKAEAKAKIADEANKAIAAIDDATTEDDVTAAKNAGKLAIAKEAAKAELEAAQAIKEKVIAGNEKLSDDEKQAVKEQVQNVVDEAKKAIDAATEQVAVDNAKTTGKEAIDALNPVGKEKALDEIQKVTEAKLEAIDKNEKLSEKEKIKAKAEVAKAAIAVVEAIESATTQAEVDAKVTEGSQAISSVAEVGKDKAKAAVDSALSAKETAIDSNAKLSDAEKSAAKAAAKKAAEDVKKAIESATTQAEVDAKVTEGSQAISSVAEVGKDKAKAAVDSALSAKETAIDSNAKLSDAEKSAAKAVAKKAAEDAKKAIESATTQAEVDEAKTTGITAISAVNPVGKEKALAEIETALAEKSKAIDARTDLLTAEKTTAKKAAESEAETAKDAIRKAMSQDDVAKVTEVGKANIAKIDPVGAKAAFKKAVEEVLADKLKEIDARTDLTFEDKNKKKELVNKVAAAAKQAIDNSTKQSDLDKALRTFLYQVDQDALVADLPELKLEDALKALINGVVKVERGTALSQADVLAKLDLPEEISVIKMELPDTNTIGTKIAIVTLRLADGSVQKLEVPVEVISPNNQDMIPPYNGGNYGPSVDNGMTNTQAKVNKSKLESAIHQLDELIIQESAKLDAETVKAANDLLSEAKTVSADANASQAEVDAMVKRIEDFMAKLAPAADHVTPAEDQSVQTPAVAPATAQAANANQEASAQANAPKESKELPNTGTADSTVAMVAAAASALLGLGLVGRRCKEDEEA
ncbi:DUF1542 domain-containing protein [Streptococcus sp. 68]|uniref:DUF1542 domain-containing protein n=1 Tax=Streptococcus sp. 68 TaxID=2582637 RepID=UPI001564BF70|nr:DUF1542 domain-containing protein [Streptococcus sp. 68]